jgi:hypothetical protein
MAFYRALIFGAGCMLAAFLPSGGIVAQTPREVAGLGFEGQGADVVVVDLNGNARPDMILMANDNPPGANSFRYRVALDLDAAGLPASFAEPFVEVPGVGAEGQGAAAAIAYLDDDPRPELIFMAYDNPPGPNTFRYRIGWNLDARGRTAIWTTHGPVTGVGEEGQGAAVIVTQIDSNPRPDMLFIAYDNPPGPNGFRYRIGFNVDSAGNATWTPTHVEVAGLGFEGQGIGAAIASLDADRRSDLVLMANDNPPGPNSFRLRFGMNLKPDGLAAWQPGFGELLGLGAEAQGAGLAITCLDGDPRADWIVMAYDDPPQMNNFRISVLPNQSQAPCPAFQLPVRKSIDQLTTQEVASLRRGVRQMMAWNNAPRDSADFRRSWVFWANIHRHLGCGVNRSKAFLGMDGVQSFQAIFPAEMATWCKCVHRTDQFLPWHRMFLHYFEQVLQVAAGDPNLRLPYWDSGASPALPVAFTSAVYVDENGKVRANPLRVEQRRARLNIGGTIDPAITSTASAMAQSSFGKFSEILEETIHDGVHCAVGVSLCPSGYMGSVPASALDPIFYLHHANIDRLYECWLRAGPPSRLQSNPAKLAEEYRFIDRAGDVQTSRVGDMLSLASLGYRYAPGGSGCPAPVGAPAPTVPPVPSGDIQPPAPPPPKLATVSGPVTLQRGVTTVPLQMPQDVRAQLPSLLAGGGRAYVMVDGLQFDQPPQVMYKAFLRGPAGIRTLIGVISLFSLSDVQDGDHEGHGTPKAQFLLDATAALKGVSGLNFAQLALVLEPINGAPDSTPVAAAQQIPAAANVRFDAVRLRMER